MDNFVLITQTDRPEDASRNRRFVRAHVARKYWQGVQRGNGSSVRSAGAKSKTPPHGSSRHSFVRSGDDQSKITALPTSTKPEPCFLPPQPCRAIGRASDAFVYAGGYLESRSYGFFHHYGAEFKVMLCNSVQPYYIDRPAVCCSTAVQMNSSALLHAICFQSAAHEAVASASAPLRATMFQDFRSAQGLERDALQHKAKALSSLRSAVEDHDTTHIATESSILCVAILLGAEAMMGDDTGLKSHAYGLQQLINAYGGLGRLSALAASVVCLADVKAALVQRRRPQFDGRSLPWRKGEDGTRAEPASVLLQDFSMDESGSGLFHPAVRSQLRPSILASICATRRLTLEVSTKTKSRQMLGVTIDDFITVEHSLASIKMDGGLSALEECVCLTLLLFTNTALWRVPLFLHWVRSLTADLKAAILRLGWSTALDHFPNLLLWMMFMGRYAGCTGSSVERHWWSEGIRIAVIRAGLTSFRDAKPLLQEFFYVDDVYDSAWERIWDSDMLGSSSVENLATFIMSKHPCDLIAIEI